ncbi:MAG: pyrroline-5-carboxylate reductase [Eubacterium sp.]|nr:pyrroline-5-carboxylate reductase [Eubacterium sp.]MBR0413008.1 pyrroline-5-carboxylate reductase [Eubacterium sp.]
MKLGFIGCGNMATAIIGGIVEKEIVQGGDINVFDVYSPAAEALNKAYGVNVLDGEISVVKQSDVVVLAVKPNVLGSVLTKINIALDESDTLLISIAAGKDLAFMRSMLSHDNRIIRVMPNINAKVGAAISAFTANSNATDDDKETCRTLFEGIGSVMELDEAQFPLFGVLGGCSPAFAYMFIDALARAGVQNGMKKDVALEIAAQAVRGSAEMILKSGIHPYELIDMVCSPGGTTIEGVQSLKADGLENAVTNAVNKAVEKDSKL